MSTIADVDRLGYNGIMRTTEVVVMMPFWDDAKKKFMWPLLQIRSTIQKGLGVFAKQKLKEGTLIPYLGIRITKAEFNDLHKLFDYYVCKDLDYIIQIDQGGFLNGHPQFDEHHLFVTSLINEPNVGQTANCYPILLKPKTLGLGVLLARDVEEGEELTMYYGDDYYRDYKVGESCSVAKILKKCYPVQSKELFNKLLCLVHVANRMRSPDMPHLEPPPPESVGRDPDLGLSISTVREVREIQSGKISK